MASISDTTPISLGGRHGEQFLIRDPFPFTGVTAVDERLSAYQVAVFRPPHREPARTPVVIGLNGMAAPYRWLGFLVPTLVDRGIACVLFETPLSGERSLVRSFSGDIIQELLGFEEHQVPVTTSLLTGLFHAVAKDYRTVLDLIDRRYGLNDSRLALFGVSLGTLLAAYAFLREGLGQRLLGTIGHADLRRFVLSFLPPTKRFLSAMPLHLLGGLAGPKATTGLAFLRVLNELSKGHEIDPMGYADRIGEGRKVRFLVGETDPVVRPPDAIACARRFPDGECRVVPGLGHGDDAFEEHVRRFLLDELADWAT